MDDIQSRLEAETGDSFVNSPKMYLGDGVYAFNRGFDVILATDRQEGLHWMALEPTMVSSLAEFLKQAREEGK